MANQRRRDRARRTGREETTALQFSLPYDRRNAIVFAVAIATILVGYICMAQPPVDGFLSLTLAPILLVIGYVFLIPAALLMKSQVEQDAADGKGETAEPAA
jgi:uncharacterized membrane protein HdeD (DUF308 family)